MPVLSYRQIADTADISFAASEILRALEKSLKILRYVPHSAYLVRASVEAMSNVERSPMVRHASFG